MNGVCMCHATSWSPPTRIIPCLVPIAFRIGSGLPPPPTTTPTSCYRRWMELNSLPVHMNELGIHPYQQEKICGLLSGQDFCHQGRPRADRAAAQGPQINLRCAESETIDFLDSGPPGRALSWNDLLLETPGSNVSHKDTQRSPAG